ncbi:uncharacterized protein LOC116457376 [Hylobates moloch]|uniref:uncharacterized protein LOC116457376 n=1 Tax=Hylobates moloch TaxID=81572 RepID=UPI0013642371|nr:uncharacterized protein LOC116457376 [Hylobates moloch]
MPTYAISQHSIDREVRSKWPSTSVNMAVNLKHCPLEEDLILICTPQDICSAHCPPAPSATTGRGSTAAARAAKRQGARANSTTRASSQSVISVSESHSTLLGSYVSELLYV